MEQGLDMNWLEALSDNHCKVPYNQFTVIWTLNLRNIRSLHAVVHCTHVHSIHYLIIHFLPDNSVLNKWSSIYVGLDTFYDDHSVTTYTTYRYRLTVYNELGYTNSKPSEEITTYGGRPREAAMVQAKSVNHTTIEVQWKEPCEWKSVLIRKCNIVTQ